MGFYIPLHVWCLDVVGIPMNSMKAPPCGLLQNCMKIILPRSIPTTQTWPHCLCFLSLTLMTSHVSYFDLFFLSLTENRSGDVQKTDGLRSSWR